jgi:hypothetical protein
MLKYREERRVMGEGGPSLKVSLQLLRLWHVHIFTRYNYRLLHAIKISTRAPQSQKGVRVFVFWHFDGSQPKSLPYYPPPNKRGKAINIATRHSIKARYIFVYRF